MAYMVHTQAVLEVLLDEADVALFGGTMYGKVEASAPHTVESVHWHYTLGALRLEGTRLLAAHASHMWHLEDREKGSLVSPRATDTTRHCHLDAAVSSVCGASKRVVDLEQLPGIGTCACQYSDGDDRW